MKVGSETDIPRSVNRAVGGAHNAVRLSSASLPSLAERAVCNGRTTVRQRSTMQRPSKRHLDGQTSMEIHLLEGNDPLVVNNRTISRFILSGLSPAQKHKYIVELTLEIDAKSTIALSARDLVSGKEFRDVSADESPSHATNGG
jgi:molecular chaperone DnaK (HSP70)